MASVNKVIVLGNLGKDPELRYTPNGTAIASVSIATTRSWKNKDSGEKMEETEWHRVQFFDRLAEIVGEYVKKGHPLYVEGRLKTRKWQDKEGVDRYTTEIIAESMQLLGGRDGGQEGGGEQRQQRSAAPAPAPRSSDGYSRTPAPAPAQRPKQPATGTGFDNMDDDIPF